MSDIPAMPRISSLPPFSRFRFVSTRLLDSLYHKGVTYIISSLMTICVRLAKPQFVLRKPSKGESALTTLMLAKPDLFHYQP